MSKELEKDLQKKFGELYKPLRDERISNTNYWKYNEYNEYSESPQANPDILPSDSHIFKTNSMAVKLGALINVLKLSSKDRIIINLYLSGLKQNQIAYELKAKHQYINARIKSICDKLKKLL